LLEDVGDSVSNGGLEGYAARVQSRKIYANELAWLEDRAHKQIVTPSRVKCKTDSWITQHFTGSVAVARKVPLILYSS
jgi:hypothetical protein